MSFPCFALVAGLWLIAPSSQARADDSPGELVRPGYGWAMAGAYVAAPLLAAGTGVLVGPELGLGVFVLTAPAVHIAYRDPSWAVLSLVGPSLSIATWYYLVYVAQGECHSTLANGTF
jgi:hypothetical protein